MKFTWAGILASICTDPNPQCDYDALTRPVGPYKWHSQLFECFSFRFTYVVPQIIYIHKPK